MKWTVNMNCHFGSPRDPNIWLITLHSEPRQMDPSYLFNGDNVYVMMYFNVISPLLTLYMKLIVSLFFFFPTQGVMEDPWLSPPWYSRTTCWIAHILNIKFYYHQIPHQKRKHTVAYSWYLERRDYSSLFERSILQNRNKAWFHPVSNPQ